MPRTFRSDLIQLLTGFLGAAFVVAVVPRAVRFIVRRVVGKFLLETVAFAALGLLLERGIDLLDRR